MRAQKLDLRLGRALPTGFLAGDGEPGPPPEPGDFTLTLLTLPGDPTESLSMSVTAGPGTVYWIIDTVAYPNTPEGAAAVIAGGGEASGSQAYTDFDINLGTIAASVTPGVYYISAVAVVGSETSNVASDELIITPVVVTFIGSTVGTTSLAIPSGAEPGDMMVMMTASDSADPTAVSGWTTISQQNNGNLRIRRSWKVVGEDEGAISTGAQRGIVGVYRNVGFAGNTIYGGFFDNKTRTPAYTLGNGDDGGNDVSGEMFRVVFWASLSTTDGQSNESPPGVTKRAGHDSSIGAFRLWMGDTTEDTRSEFSGSQTGSNASRSAWVAKLRTT